jgi:transcriptional regulator with XRE-family HTH domain
MNINEKIYRNTKALCKINGQSLKEIEQQIGRNPGYLSRKSTKVEVETLMKLCDLLDVTPEELMNRDYEHDLEIKEALDGLRSAILNVKQYFNEDGIMNFIGPLLIEEMPDEEES